MAASSQSFWDIEVYFDGDCPLCRREVAYLHGPTDALAFGSRISPRLPSPPRRSASTTKS